MAWRSRSGNGAGAPLLASAPRWVMAAALLVAATAFGACRSTQNAGYYDQTRPLWKDLVGEEYKVAFPEYEFEKYDLSGAEYQLLRSQRREP